MNHNPFFLCGFAPDFNFKAIPLYFIIYAPKFEIWHDSESLSLY